MNIRLVYQIAKQEVSQYCMPVDARMVLAVIGVCTLVGGLVIAGGGLAGLTEANGSVSEDIYRVGAPPDSTYYNAFQASPEIDVKTLDRRAFERGEIDALVYQNGSVAYRATDKSYAALSTAQSALQSYNTAQLEQEENQTAAFPVVVSITKAQQTGVLVDSDSSTDNESVGEDTERQDSGTIDAPSAATVGSVPKDVQPPFPYDAIALAVLFVVPMNFIVQSFSSSLISDRVTKRTELLLASPASSMDMIIGKTLPYFAALTLTTTALAVTLGVSYLSVLAVLSLALTFLATGFLGGLFARSFKELTFIISTASIFLIMFAFVPALFSTVHPISVISPLSIVVFELRGDSVALADFLFATLPLTFTGSVMFAFGKGVFREEELFTEKRVPAKLIQMLSSQVHSWKTAFWMSVALMPFVFAAELLSIALLFVVPTSLSVPVLLTTIAAIEEVAKSIAIYASYQTGRLEKTLRIAAFAGAAGGFGFFVAEKVTVVTQAVGLLNVTLGSIVFSSGAGSGLPPIFAILWVALHSITAVISVIGGLKGRYGYIAGLTGAVIVHVGYNFGVLMYA